MSPQQTHDPERSPADWRQAVGTPDAYHDADHPFRYSSWLHAFAIVLVIATFALITLGGTVTSKGVGLSVPDWPTTYGENMFLFPPSKWKGGVFWEHTHRLLGAAVGLLTIGMAAWLWRVQRSRRWLGKLGVAAVVLVVVQGVMGGLRVTEMSPALGVLHGVTAQLFLGVTVVIAGATSRWWHEAVAYTTEQRHDYGFHTRFSRKLRYASLALLGVLLIQLVLGASMRHSGSRLAIPDFPAAYGGVIPPLTTQGLQDAIDAQPYERHTQYFSPLQVGVHFAHRLWAVGVVAAACWLLARLAVEAPGDPRLTGPMTALAGLLLFQLALGALVIWSGSTTLNNDIATTHQATGAAIFATATLLALRVHVMPPLHRKYFYASSRTAVSWKGASA